MKKRLGGADPCAFGGDAGDWTDLLSLIPVVIVIGLLTIICHLESRKIEKKHEAKSQAIIEEMKNEK